ncbi:MAG: DUF4247 domain-containing protein [Pseudonocardia sp.]|nr:DUF4247 domain-containing protein [Pseudonocardia sp.]
MRWRAGVAALLGVAVLLAGCGSSDEVRSFIADTYALQGTSGDSATYLSDAPVGTTTAAIVAAVPPAAHDAADQSEYLRYDDDIVVITAAAAGGSTVRVEDLDDRYSRGYYTFLGPGFRPGSPAAGSGSGGPGDAK